MKRSLWWGYVKERRTWIFYFFCVLLFLDALLLLDMSITASMQSILYLNLVLVVSFVLFFIFRYYRETVFLRKLEELKETPFADWKDVIGVVEHMSDEMMREVLVEMDRAYREERTKMRELHILEVDHLDAWVHELKAPLTAMRLIMDRDRMNPSVQALESDWLRLYLLLDEQLYLSRLNTLSSDYLLECVDLYPHIIQEVKLLASWCFERNIAVELEGDDTFDVLTDAKWSPFIVRQLLTNAVKYSPEGGTITICFSKEGQYPSLAITDEGPGIPSSDIPRIFERGYTGKKGRVSNVATGLGLYLAKTIGDRIGNALRVKSTVGEGTTMTVYFTKENDYDDLQKIRATSREVTRCMSES